MAGLSEGLRPAVDGRRAGVYGRRPAGDGGSLAAVRFLGGNAGHRHVRVLPGEVVTGPGGGASSHAGVRGGATSSPCAHYGPPDDSRTRSAGGCRGMSRPSGAARRGTDPRGPAGRGGGRTTDRADAQIRRSRPRRVTLVVPPASRNLVETCPYVDEVLTSRRCRPTAARLSPSFVGVRHGRVRRRVVAAAVRFGNCSPVGRGRAARRCGRVPERRALAGRSLARRSRRRG